MKTKAMYFSHDSNARNDDKIIALRMRHGAEGYGIFFMILERMRDEADYMCIKDYNVIAFDLRVSAEKVKSVVEDFGLFSFIENGKRFYSESFLNRMGKKDNISQKRSEAGKIGMQKRYNINEENNDESDEITKCNKKLTNVIKSDAFVITKEKKNIASKVKESKEKEKKIKEKNICQNSSNFDRECSSHNHSSCEEKANTPQSNEELIFEECRKLYPGVKRGFLTEFTEFKRKHKTLWREALHKLKPAIEDEIEHKRKSEEYGAFTPEWKNFKTWLSQKCWEQELPDVVKIKGGKNGTSTNYQVKRPAWFSGEK